MELALIAFDGADPRVLYEKRDKLETFDQVMRNSQHGKWKTPGHTIPSFTATLTGRQYNNCNFHWDEDKGDYKKHRQTGFDYMWDEADFSMTLLNLPVLYPPEDIDDAMVCGFLTPDGLVEDNLALPDEVQEYLNEYGYIHDIPSDGTYEELGGEKMKEMLYQMMRDRVEVSEWLIDQYDSDLFYGVWTATDRWFHQCQVHGEEYMPMYEEADEVLSDILEVIPDDVPKIIFSDHGFSHFPGDSHIHKGHAVEGWYSILDADLPAHRDDACSIFDLYPTVMNYMEQDIKDEAKGRILLNNEEQEEEVASRLDDLGYL